MWKSKGFFYNYLYNVILYYIKQTFITFLKNGGVRLFIDIKNFFIIIKNVD